MSISGELLCASSGVAAATVGCCGATAIGAGMSVCTGVSGSLSDVPELDELELLEESELLELVELLDVESPLL